MGLGRGQGGEAHSAQACGKVTRPPLLVSPVISAESKDVLTPVLVPPPSSILTSHLRPPSTPTPLGPSLHTCPHASPSAWHFWPHLPPSSDGACSGEPPREVLLFPAPHKGRFGGQSCLPHHPSKLSCHGGKQTGTGKRPPPLPGSCTPLVGGLGTLVQAVVLAHVCLGDAHLGWPGAWGPDESVQPGSALQGWGVSCDGQLWQARSPQSSQGHAVQARKAWGGGAEAAADDGLDSMVTNLEAGRDRSGRAGQRLSQSAVVPG